MIDILYVDNHVLVVDKPPGMLSQADETGDEDVLTLMKAWVGREFNKPGNVYLGLVHRLDRPASGLMVLARTSKAAGRLSEQFRKRTVEKRYLAWVQGHPPETGYLADWLAKKEREVSVVEEGEEGGKLARLEYQIIHRGKKASLAAVTLHTGRPHQVRIQFASRGFPLVGDFRYGADQELDGRNLALHAAAVAIDHPTLRERTGWTSVPGMHWPEGIRIVAREWLENWCEEHGFPFGTSAL